MPDHDAKDPSLQCYRCGASLASLTPPLSRRDLCPECSVELHVCRMCLHFAPGKPDDCVEEDAIAVRDKSAANFCDYFTPNASAFDGREKRAESGARQQLADLFGDDAAGDSEPAQESTQADDALAEAEKLFGK